MSIYQKLAKIQSELKAPKNQYNGFGKYNYRSCEDILEAAKPLAIKHGAVLMLMDNVVERGGKVYTEASAVLIDTEDNSKIVATASAREPESKKGMDEMQISGCASSYARKYALGGLFSLDDTKDSDAPENHPNYTKGGDKSKAQAGRKKLVCADCGKEITADEIGGKMYSAEKIAESAIKKFGKPLCFGCVAKH